MTSEIRLFTRESVAKAKQIVANPDEPADPERGRGFAEWAMLALHALRIELGKSYRQTIDILSEMPGILEEIGLTKLPHFTVLRDWFETISMARWRAFLGASAEKRTGHAAVDATGFDRDQPSRHYVQRAHYRVRSLKVTTLVDVETLYVTDVHCTTTKKHDAKIGPQVARRNAGDLLSLAANKGYDAKAFRDELCETEFVHSSSIGCTTRSITLTTPAWTRTAIIAAGWLKRRFRRSSARSAPPCVRGAGIWSFGK